MYVLSLSFSLSFSLSLSARCGNFPPPPPPPLNIHFKRLYPQNDLVFKKNKRIALFAVKQASLTFDNVAVDCGFEVLPGLLVEVLAVDDPHLFEESGLAALASAQQQDLHQPFHVPSLDCLPSILRDFKAQPLLTQTLLSAVK
uniref:Uncharacterized protein n=1 Tax=Dicentrarchus labrax TaxID=13489 RepID=A0A8C4ISC1_DICLA